jgi:hypothetical protein
MGPGNSENDVIMDDGNKDGGDSVGGLNDNGDWLCADL